jgi:hypothetical protein
MHVSGASEMLSCHRPLSPCSDLRGISDHVLTVAAEQRFYCANECTAKILLKLYPDVLKQLTSLYDDGS